MAPDRVTVDDDALISTDVDKLIKTISSKGTIALGELERETGIGRKSMSKWIHVLEEEGYIKVEYRLTKTYVSWIGESVSEVEEAEPAAPVEEEQVSPFQSFTPEPEKSPFKSEEEEEHRKKKKVLEDLHEEGALGEEPTAVEEAEKEAVSRVKKPKDEGKDTTFDALRADLENEVKKDIEEIGKDHTELEVEEPEIHLSEAQVQKEVLAKPERRKGVPLREKVDSYLAEINHQRKEVELLKKEKENLYRDRYLKLESKVESDIVSITERILEKEGRLLDLKEKLLELPDKVEEADKLQSAVEKIGKEGRNALSAAQEKVSDLLAATQAAEEELTARMAGIHKELDKGRKKLVELDSEVSAINADETKLRGMLGEMNTQMEDLNRRMQETTNSLEESAELKIEITELTDQLRVSIDRRERQLSDLDQQLEEIKKVENWVKEYVTDYEKKIEEIESYVSRSEEEMEDLREAAEKAYISKYLKELEGVTRLYEGELEGISMDEKQLDRQIAEAKSRLTGLINESQQMLRTLYKEGDSEDRFGSALREKREKTSRVRSLVEEKESEKERLSEDIARAKDRRKSVPSRPASKPDNSKGKKSGKK